MVAGFILPAPTIVARRFKNMGYGEDYSRGLRGF
jgi:hypothetical protein